MSWDVYLSAAPVDDDRLSTATRALRDAGINVRSAMHSSDSFAPRSASEVAALAECRLVLCWMSHDYSCYRSCREEFVAAARAAEAGSESDARLLVVNPEPTTDHVPTLPVGHTTALGDLIGQVKARLARLDGVVGGPAGPDPEPVHYGSPQSHDTSEHFVGRLVELFTLHAGLRLQHKGDGGRRRVLLTGPAGSGKSTLVAEYARLFGYEHPVGVFRLSAGEIASRESLDIGHAGIKDLAGSFGVDVRGRTPEAARKQFRAALAAAGTGLWVVDDLPDQPTDDALSAWQCPEPSYPEILIARGGRDLSAGRLELGPLRSAESVVMLVAGPDLTSRQRESATAVAARYGNYPLALHVAGSAAAKPSGPPAAPGRMTDIIRAAGLAEPYASATAATVTEWLAAVPPLCIGLLQVSRCLAPEAIPVELAVRVLETLRRASGATRRNWRQAWRRQRGQSLPAEAWQALAGDGRGRLWDLDDERDWLTVHRLVGEAAMALGSGVEAGEAAAGIYAAAATELANSLSDLLDAAGALDADQRLTLTHARHVCAALPEGAPKRKLALLLADIDYSIGRAVNVLTVLRRNREATAVARRDALGGDDVRAMEAQVELAETLVNAGEFQQALRLAEDYLHAKRSAVRSTQALRMRHVRAVCFQWLGDGQRARDELEDLLRQEEAELGPEHWLTLRTRAAFAFLLRQLGLIDQALAQIEEVVATRRRLLGADHRDTLAAENIRGSTLFERGSLEEASRVHASVLERREKVLGSGDVDTNTSRSSLAATFMALGRYAEARPELERALAGYTEVLGAEHPFTLTAQTNLAQVMYELGDEQEARRLLRRSIRVREQRYPGAAELTRERNVLAEWGDR